MSRLEGKVAIVTGGCGGAGVEICKAFAKEGACVVISDLNEEAGKNIVNEITSSGGKAIFVKTDVTKEMDVKKCVETSVDTYGKLDTLVNIACIMSVDTGYFTDVTEEMFDLDININLKGTFFFTKYALLEMKKCKKGKIINFSSVGASHGTLGHTIYGAAKAGIESMTRSIATQYGNDNICANCIRPGIMLNPISLSMPGVKEYGDFILSHIPGTRIGLGADAAPLAVYLASDESDYVNGQVITLDGGLTCHEPQWKEDIDPENADAVR